MPGQVSEMVPMLFPKGPHEVLSSKSTTIPELLINIHRMAMFLTSNSSYRKTDANRLVQKIQTWSEDNHMSLKVEKSKILCLRGSASYESGDSFAVVS